MSTCHNCPYGIMTQTTSGNLAYTDRAQQVMDEHPDNPFDHLPCKTCLLPEHSGGSISRPGAIAVSLDALSEEGLFQEDVVKQNIGNDDVHISIKITQTLMSILNQLDQSLRDIIVFKMKHPLIPMRVVTDAVGSKGDSARQRLIRACTNYPILNAVLNPNGERINLDEALQEQMKQIQAKEDHFKTIINELVKDRKTQQEQLALAMHFYPTKRELLETLKNLKKSNKERKTYN